MTDKGDAALERIATALEQMALDRAALIVAQMGDDEPPLPTPPPNLPVTPIMAPLPPVVAAPFQFTASTAVTACPVHHQPWKTVPAGVSKKTGRAYTAFLVCQESGCEQRPTA